MSYFSDTDWKSSSPFIKMKIPRAFACGIWTLTKTKSIVMSVFRITRRRIFPWSLRKVPPFIWLASSKYILFWTLAIWTFDPTALVNFFSHAIACVAGRNTYRIMLFTGAHAAIAFLATAIPSFSWTTGTIIFRLFKETFRSSGAVTRTTTFWFMQVTHFSCSLAFGT